MKRIMMGFVVLTCLISSYAYATIYDYTGPNFTVVKGDYTTSMKVTATIVTSSPIPPNENSYDISGILISWSFFDGVQTINSTNGIRSPIPSAFTFDTDANGNITSHVTLVHLAPIPTMSGQKGSYIDSNIFFGDYAVIDEECTADDSGACVEYGEIDSYGQSFPGVWVTRAEPPAEPPKPVPTLPQWMLILLMLGMVGIAFGRRRV